ncbi:MAG: 23S rRNA (adenine(2030)-N(6))-methyltransferase RlmJ [Xanthobacteraceae bacterium]|jgi:23S rRNA (adenine2030-N6)-methyltransferase
MNYQHAFHAGNFADVHKHVVLTRVLEHLRAKPAAFRVIDSHAGAGRYDLLGPEATRTGEWHDGIERVLAQRQPGTVRVSDGSSPQALLEPYLKIIAALNPAGALRVYPGSPLVAKALLRPQDRLIACELEPRARAALVAVLRGEPRAKVLAIDGWMALNANVPPKERRGVVLIDPPYEDAGDFMRLSGAFHEAHRKWPTGIYLLWYPIKDRAAPEALARRLLRLDVPKMLRCEITLRAPSADGGLVGSGLIVVNPPFRLADELKILLPALGGMFSPTSGHQLDWLTVEHAPRR